MKIASSKLSKESSLPYWAMSYPFLVLVVVFILINVGNSPSYILQHLNELFGEFFMWLVLFLPVLVIISGYFFFKTRALMRAGQIPAFWKFLLLIVAVVVLWGYVTRELPDLAYFADTTRAKYLSQFYLPIVSLGTAICFAGSYIIFALTTRRFSN